MSLRQFFAGQLGLPSGWFGRHVMGRFLNRSTARHNELVRQELAVTAGDRVLEVGFGGAALLEKLCAEASPGSIAGIELSDEMLAAAMNRLRTQIAAGRVVLERGSVEALPFQDAQFDKACTVNTTYFWSDLTVGFAELGRVLRPGGRVVIGFMSADDIVRGGLDRHGFACHSTEQMEKALAAASFEVSRLTSGSDWRGTFYAMTAVRSSIGTTYRSETP
jgi:ubiquinone/menaquinone biosynthesis C-methylase UbiE